jgi:hypothetical protein
MTQTHVFAVAPCGCKLPIPNEAYETRVDLEPCDCGRGPQSVKVETLNGIPTCVWEGGPR